MKELRITTDSVETLNVYTFYYGDGYDCNSYYHTRTLEGALKFLKNNVRFSKKELEKLNSVELSGVEADDFKVIENFVKSLDCSYCDRLNFYRDTIELW